MTDYTRYIKETYFDNFRGVKVKELLEVGLKKIPKCLHKRNKFILSPRNRAFLLFI